MLLKHTCSVCDWHVERLGDRRYRYCLGIWSILDSVRLAMEHVAGWAVCTGLLSTLGAGLTGTPVGCGSFLT